MQDGNAPATDTATIDTTAETPATVDSGTGTQPTNTQTDTTQTEITGADDVESEFKIPDQYKEKSWAAKIKSEEDLYKQIENLTSLAGKKYAVPDFETATPQEIETYLKTVRPESHEAYNFATSEDYQAGPLDEPLAKLLYDIGIPAHQGNKLIEGYQKLLGEHAQTLYGVDTFMQEMKESFGNDYETKVDQTRQILEANASPEDKELLNSIPSKFLSAMYRIASNIDTAYGASESGLAGEQKGGVTQTVDFATEQANVRKQLRELTNRPYEAGEKQALIDKLYELTTAEMKLKGKK